MMGNFFYSLGRKTGKAMRKPKWYFKSFFGDEQEALHAENIFGHELAEQMKQEFTLIDDPKIMNLVNQVGDVLKQRVKRAERKFTFIPVRSEDINAFALPGGYIFLTSGILELCEYKPDALAFILSHEMVHVVSRHPLKRILTSKSLGVLANMLKAGSLAGQLARKTLSSLIESAYSQENEFDADRYGLQLAVRSGYSGQPGIDTLKKLQKVSKTNDRFNYFSTHPPLDERISKTTSVLKML